MPIEYSQSGIVTQNLVEILEERETELKSTLGDDFVIDKSSPIGSMELADANSEASVQELIAWLIPNQLDGQTATGIFLDAICEKNKIYRLQPSRTTFYLTLKGTQNASFNAGDITVTNNEIYYNLDETCTIGVDGSVTAKFKCELYGNYEPISPYEFSIETPVIGLNSVTFDILTAQLSVGRNAETDEELRRRRENSVQQTATNTLESITSSLYSVDGVERVTALENDNETVDSNNVPAKSFEVIICGGEDNDIAKAIYNNKPCGIKAHGTTVKTIKDSFNNPHAVGFTRVKEINICMEISTTTTSSQSTSWKKNVANKIKEHFDKIQDIGYDVKSYNFYSVLTEYDVITDVTYVKFYKKGQSISTAVSTYPIGIREIARIDSDDISINFG